MIEIRQTQIAPVIERKAPKSKPSVVRSTPPATSELNQLTTDKTVAKAGDNSAFVKADSFRQAGGFSESLSSKSAVALDAYESHEKEDKRAALRQMMGVDLYA